MAQIFHPSTNTVSKATIFGAVFIIAALVWIGGIYVRSSYATQVNVAVEQPLPFSHKHHVGGLGIDCRYCHTGVEKSWFSNIPASSTCMNCHSTVLKDDPRLAPVRESAATGTPVAWVQIHKLPDFAYFNHSVHVNRGISCVECHGRIDQMDEVYHAKPFSMAFCLECHRHPELKLRPPDKITDLAWQPKSEAQQEEFGKRALKEWKVESLQTCSACHR